MEQLARLARELAAGHPIQPRHRERSLQDRLHQHEACIRSFNRTTLLAQATRGLTPAEEWLLDNFFLIEEQILMARRHLPPGYSRLLPRLASGPAAGLPRVHEIARELIAHVDAQIDAAPLRAFIEAYQSVQVLCLGELWAVPIMLRLNLIDCLCAICDRLDRARTDRDQASHWVDRLRDTAEVRPDGIVVVVAEMAGADLRCTSSFVAEFCQRLSRQSPSLHLARSWLEQRLATEGLSIETLVQREARNQAADQVTVRHAIASLRFLSAMKWKDFVEDLSRVERILRSEPSGVYGRMDFATRDRYRHAVENLARHGRLGEVSVAQAALRLAAEAAPSGLQDRATHVGYYLVDEGRPALERAVGLRGRGRGRVERTVRRFPLTLYGGGIATLTLLFTAALAVPFGLATLPPALLALLLPVLVLCASQPAVALVNWACSMVVAPRLLPRMETCDGIAPGDRTMVVVPTLISTPESVDHLLTALEIHAFANRDDHIHFALLTDLSDADAESLEGDEALVARARAGIATLNERHPCAGSSRFFLFHRSRRWNDGEQRWMGHERKRGKLADFNARLRGGAPGAFSVVEGDTGVLASVRYVITLDTDTLLPRDAARRLVGTLAHPLNRPVYDAGRGIVTAGYGILQPRVSASLPSARRSWFARIYGGDTGLDPYTRQVSDLYQDVFREGSFVGKGIYDVEAFQLALHGRFPDNAVLSHDLLESCHARCALVSDIELYEDSPTRYALETDRRHRWIRGDWQTCRWLSRRVPGGGPGGMANPLTVLSQWKLLDNLRRSLVPPALLVLLLVGVLAPAGTVGWTLALVPAILALPGLVTTLAGLMNKAADHPLGAHLGLVAARLGRHALQVFFAVAFLPHAASISLDAILRTLMRLLVTRRRLLQWRSSAEAERDLRHGLAGYLATMWITPATALVAGAWLVAHHPDRLPGVSPLLAAWLLAPVFAWCISRPSAVPPANLSLDQVAFLRRLGRTTWNYFETYVTAEHHGLPPDNVQHNPEERVAARTSPTNLGLSLLANLAAWDLGHLSGGGLLRRTRDSLDTMDRLERHGGHFFNWYDTRTLLPMPPLYVSTVDSGNLAGHLLTLASGLREVSEAPVIAADLFASLADGLDVLFASTPPEAALRALREELRVPPAGIAAALSGLDRLTSALAGTPGEWAASVRAQVSEIEAEARHLLPWASPAPASPLALLDRVPTLNELAGLSDQLVEWQREHGDVPADVLARVAGGAERARERRTALDAEARRCDAFATMDFTLLYDRDRCLFSIGYNLSERRLDSSHYDLLASEARLGSFVAIALGQIPQEHWFCLGRQLVSLDQRSILVSWGGSMFEYLMPLLVMPDYEYTLLGQACRAAVRRQIDYGRDRQVPWGISESGYNMVDAERNYQYRAFGVPGLGFKRGLATDLVVAPYAGAMALLLLPREACANLQRLARDGQCGPQGFYEAIDYTASRLPPGDASATVRSHMVHHQGMSLLALVHLLKGAPMQRRFLACPMLKAADLLLQERVPRRVPREVGRDLELETALAAPADAGRGLRVFTDPTPPSPELLLLSNGRYHVALSSAGGGYSRWRNLAVTRWREDATRDDWGVFVYVRDRESGEIGSVTHQPTGRSGRTLDIVFSQSQADFRHLHEGLEVRTTVCVSPEDDVEVRRVTLVNTSPRERLLELTTYAEVVLSPQATDQAHPAFGNLFVQTEFLPGQSALLCTRRSGSAEESAPWLFHALVAPGAVAGPATCETDRRSFLGRGGSPRAPAALRGPPDLPNTVGSVLDPIVALRRTVRLPPHETITVDLVLGVCETREAAVGLVEKYQSARMAERACDLAWTHGQVTLRQLNATEEEGRLYGRLAGALVYIDVAQRAPASVLRNNQRGQSALWAYGISGDTPIVLLRMREPQRVEIARQAILAHAYWRMKGLPVELVILIDDVSVYQQSLRERIVGWIASGNEGHLLDQPRGIFVRRLVDIPPEDRDLLASAARLVLDDEHGTLAEQVERRGPTPIPVVAFRASQLPRRHPAPPPLRRELLFANGLGGFTRDGHEYVITLPPGRMTPAPWVNVLANPGFGTVVSETGNAYTWAENAHEFRLTPWDNDPVRDTGGEALYLRDEETGQVWSPTPGPARGATPYVIRHGFGYTVFEHTENGIASELWVYVSIEDPVKFSVLKTRNLSERPRRLSATGYCEWVLTDLRSRGQPHGQTERDPGTGALLARNPFNTDFPGRVAFLDVQDGAHSCTGDRREFIGRNGDLAHPAALTRARLSGRTGAGLDPCGAVQVVFDLPGGREQETTFRLGLGRTADEARELIHRHRQPGADRAALERVWAYWNRTLGAVNVDTPEPALNVLANGWLLYQTLACRVWARTGFYQSGGAFGFRDQLQDVLALVHSEPALTRAHLLRAAARQFPEGDVQHWWHPPGNRGVRTGFSDDFLWLPYAVCHYVEAVADTGVLEERVPFVTGRALTPGEESHYDTPGISEQSATLYQHAVLALEHGLRFGAHGLPLMGCGDWNDGMNRVGHKGTGESVWLAFFLYEVLMRFAPLALARGDAPFAERCRSQALQLQRNLETEAWDGDWYLRAFFDDGTPLGSHAGSVCRIDSLPQSWSVLSGGGDPVRSRQALDAVDRLLVRRETGLIQLFDPPFDQTPLDPGYIKGYIPGVRENGGQYTHAAIWTIMAFARMGDIERAWELFRLINPVLHADTAARMETYKVEPYVVAADIYAVPPHAGRGGWTWYTGSAGWMYRLIMETLLGLNLEGEVLRLTPRLPKAWPGCKLHYRYRRTVYHITLARLPADAPVASTLLLDGTNLPGNSFPLRDDLVEHFVEYHYR